MDNPAIVESLGIGMGTLKAHINRIYSKAGEKPSRGDYKRSRVSGLNIIGCNSRLARTAGLFYGVIYNRAYNRG